MNKAHAVLWDAGGVIYTFDQGKTDRKLAARCGKTQEEISATLFGGAAEGKEYNKGLVEPYNLGHINSRTFYENVKRELGLDMSFDEFAEAWSDIFTLNEDIVYYIRASREEGIKQGSEQLKKGTDFITGKSGALTNLFDSFKKIIPTSNYSVSKPIKTNEGTIEIKAGEKSGKVTKAVKGSSGFMGKIMNRKVLVPALIIGGIYFGFRKLTKVK